MISKSKDQRYFRGSLYMKLCHPKYHLVAGKEKDNQNACHQEVHFDRNNARPKAREQNV